ncbi:hypothetical protein C475_09984 [Halosimplex carlsbadense 2-9-1]|uniref:DUF7973 domain-containing protein n=1 Tax=Halosimplex carlsbadense 2-9-1 TaxID=797114 RepID=M0CR91_9EURY|nr:hypothetical protein [Halosimplex carlsbadense]ELZ25780.1 hypothetical protein C475_09984 [Halosimplex carlsbadense 2-9-1]
MTLADLVAVELLVAAFAGGAFGAAVGALPSFSLAGLVVVVGELYAMGVRSLGGAVPVDVTGSVAFGAVLGPHVAFGGGAAAVAYASRRGYLNSAGDAHDAKDVTRGLGSRPDVLAVGGAFGVVGYWVATLAGSLSLPVDPVALGVVVSALAHRVVLGYSVVGAPASRLFDMSPFERDRGDESVGADGGPSVETDGGRDAAAGASTARSVDPWLPYQFRWGEVASLGAVVGVLSAYTAYLTGSAFLAFGITVAVLFLLCAGVAEIPVTHHMALPASTAVVALAGVSGGVPAPGVVAESVSLGVALAVGGAFGVLGGLVGEVAQRVFYAHAGTHLDPPAASIVVTSGVIGALAIAGVLPAAAWVPTP